MTDFHTALQRSDFFKAAECWERAKQRREAFRRALHEPLMAKSIILHSATLGRASGNAPVWILCLTRLCRLETVRVVLNAKVEPYSHQAIQRVLNAVVDARPAADPP